MSAIFEKSLLCELEVKSALLSLHDRGLIQLDKLNGEVSSVEEDEPLFPSGMVPDSVEANEQYKKMQEEVPEVTSDSMVLKLSDVDQDVKISLRDDDLHEEQESVSARCRPFPWFDVVWRANLLFGFKMIGFYWGWGTLPLLAE